MWKTTTKRYTPTWKRRPVAWRMERREMSLTSEESLCGCGHPPSHHFKTEDSIGRWFFCLSCECFADQREEEDGSAGVS